MASRMTFDEAKEQLRFHCSTDRRVDDPRWAAGFLSSLGAYNGLKREVMEDVRRCFAAVRDHLGSAPSIDREVINSLWGIVHFGRAWAIEPDGMLQRNQLISDADAAELKVWLEELSYDIASVLDSGHENDA